MCIRDSPYTKKLMAAVPIADPSRRHMKRTLLSDEIPSPIRKLGDEPVVQPLVQVCLLYTSRCV